MAASARIIYAPTSLGGAHVAAATRYTILAQQEINRAVAMAASITAFGVTPANIESPNTDFSVAAGQGGTFYSAITTLQTSLNTITSASLANLDQG